MWYSLAMNNGYDTALQMESMTYPKCAENINTGVFGLFELYYIASGKRCLDDNNRDHAIRLAAECRRSGYRKCRW